jgi:hypothetical protein
MITKLFRSYGVTPGVYVITVTPTPTGPCEFPVS